MLPVDKKPEVMGEKNVLLHYRVAHSIAHGVTVILSMMVHRLIYFIEAVLLDWNRSLYRRLFSPLLTAPPLPPPSLLDVAS